MNRLKVIAALGVILFGGYLYAASHTVAQSAPAPGPAEALDESGAGG